MGSTQRDTCLCIARTQKSEHAKLGTVVELEVSLAKDIYTARHMLFLLVCSNSNMCKEVRWVSEKGEREEG